MTRSQTYLLVLGFLATLALVASGCGKGTKAATPEGPSSPTPMEGTAEDVDADDLLDSDNEPIAGPDTATAEDDEDVEEMDEGTDSEESADFSDAMGGEDDDVPIDDESFDDEDEDDEDEE